MSKSSKTLLLLVAAAFLLGGPSTALAANFVPNMKTLHKRFAAGWSYREKTLPKSYKISGTTLQKTQGKSHAIWHFEYPGDNLRKVSVDKLAKKVNISQATISRNNGKKATYWNRELAGVLTFVRTGNDLEITHDFGGVERVMKGKVDNGRFVVKDPSLGPDVVATTTSKKLGEAARYESFGHSIMRRMQSIAKQKARQQNH